MGPLLLKFDLTQIENKEQRSWTLIEAYVFNACIERQKEINGIKTKPAMVYDIRTWSLAWLWHIDCLMMEMQSTMYPNIKIQYLMCMIHTVGNSDEFFFLRPVLYLSIICCCFVPAPGKQLTNHLSVERACESFNHELSVGFRQSWTGSYCDSTPTALSQLRQAHRA